MSEKKTILICADHEEYPVPLIGTMVFHGAERWCPFCGETGDIFYGERVELTRELEKRKEIYKQEYSEYLDAKGALACSSLVWEGKRITPNELPQEEKDRCWRIINNGWKQNIKAEDLKN